MFISCAFLFLPHRALPNHHEPNSRERERDRDLHSHLGAPPPLISPKPQPRDHAPAPPTTLWNPASLIETSSESRRLLHEPHSGHYDLSRLPPPPTKSERHYSSEKPKEVIEKFPLIRPTGFSEPRPFLVELEKSTQSFLNQQRATQSLTSQYGELSGALKNSTHKSLHGPQIRSGVETMLVYDEFLQQHRRPISKLDLEERRRKEAREKGG